MREKVLPRVRKLLEKAASTTSEEEAMIFNQKAEELLIKWKIEEIELQLESVEEQEIVVVDVDQFVAGPTVPGYSNLLHYVASHFGCKGFVLAQRKPGTKTVEEKILKVIGVQSDCDSVILIYTSLKTQVQGFLLKAQEDDPYFSSYSTRDKNIWSRSFIRGFAVRVGERFKESTKVHSEQITHSVELALKSREQKVEEFVGTLRFRPPRRSSSFWDVVQQGRVAAEQADIGATQVPTKNNVQLSK